MRKTHLITTIVAMLLPYQAGAATAITLDNFENGISEKWQEKEFVGNTQYTLAEIDGKKCIKSTSDSSASGLFYEVDIDPKEYPNLSWEWRIDQIVEGGDAAKKSGDDYAARVYVVFPGFFFWQTKALNYVWANKLEKDAMMPNAYTSSAMMIAVESGTDNTHKFIKVQRNIYEDYKAAFGSEPPKVGQSPL